eukprot:3948535-Pleurochrysis_carterae.AAC.1
MHQARPEAAGAGATTLRVFSRLLLIFIKCLRYRVRDHVKMIHCSSICVATHLSATGSYDPSLIPAIIAVFQSSVCAIDCSFSHPLCLFAIPHSRALCPMLALPD